jgi:hypothetical protein
VKTTVELPDPLFRKAKAAAAEQGKSLKQFFTEAVTDHLRRDAPPLGNAEPWRVAFGELRHLHRENRRIERIIEEEFEKIDEEEWR